MLIKKIRNSLSAKVFLWIAGMLVLCSLLIYGIVMIFLPQSYTVVAKNQVSSDISELIETLSNTNRADADSVIEAFCQNNHALVILNDGAFSVTYGSVRKSDKQEGEILTSALEVTFKNTDQVFVLNITAPVSAGQELTMAFLELLPLIAVSILLISTIGALVCSRIVVKPVLEISSISDRMANLDMTWKCSVNRTDELGVLAKSLNSMSLKLDAATRGSHFSVGKSRRTALSKSA